ncbi:helix-turn-helix domain-containing protein [Cohnella thermotolerans]|uniref:helix-turn-helix domain-containing protein n=1 Tax=Cohnella thermotolerans TaxID=329858 RepID=UPI0003FB34CD|nr:AraC family transcriptional regulator [Cohnella thermotolerans]
MNPSPSPTDRGILQAKEGMKRFALERYEPSEDLACFVERYWTVRWDLRGQDPYRQTILSYPSVNLSFEKTCDGTFAGVYGVPQKTFTRHLHEDGFVLGVKFRPGGFYPFWQKPVSQLTGRTVAFADLFGSEASEAEGLIFAGADEAEMIRVLESFLRGRSPERDENVERVQRIVQAVVDDREMTRVDDLASRFGLGKRTLQRLFDRYVGVSPKWIIQRYRLQEAAERMEAGERPDWGQLAQILGYFDQAHFIKDFKALIGKSPEAYRSDAGSADSSGATNA